MTHPLEHLYERLLFSYPSDYRVSRGDELVATALELARPGQRLPDLGEVVGFVLGGLRTRARVARAGAGAMTWADGLRLGAAMLMAAALAGQINNLLFTAAVRPHLLPTVMIGVILGLLRAPRRIWLLLIGIGLELVWNHLAGVWPLITNQEPTGSIRTTVLFVENVLPWVAPFALAGSAFIWQPHARRGPTVWPWWFVAIVTLSPSVEALRGVATALHSVRALAVGLSWVNFSWPLLVLGVAIAVREARLGIAVAAWACGSLFMTGALLFPFTEPSTGWLVNPAIPALAWLAVALFSTVLINRRFVGV